MNFFRQSQVNFFTNMLERKVCTERFYLVFGNVSCDLDSIVSSLMHAWFLSKLDANKAINCIPVLSINEKLFHLRTEGKYFLSKFGIPKSKFLFMDDVGIKALSQFPRNSLQITLVDHHILSRSASFLEPSVVEIIDHRKQEKTFPPDVKVEITTVGSCATLIAERIFNALDKNEITLNDNELKEICLMLAGPIMVDTVNFLPAAGKTTERDTKVMKQILQHVSQDILNQFYNDLCQAKNSIEGFSAQDLLQKDPKYISNSSNDLKVMFSTLVEKISEFEKRSDSKDAVSSYCQENKFNLWIGLCPVQKDVNSTPFKPVLVFSSDEDLKLKVISKLIESSSPPLNMQHPETQTLLSGCTLLRMYNTKASRKQILPVVQDFINRNATSQ